MGSFGISVSNADPVWREAAARLLEESANQLVSEANLPPEQAEHARTLAARLRAIATR
jgi:hypothetical protein